MDFNANKLSYVFVNYSENVHKVPNKYFSDIDWFKIEGVLEDKKMYSVDYSLHTELRDKTDNSIKINSIKKDCLRTDSLPLDARGCRYGRKTSFNYSGNTDELTIDVIKEDILKVGIHCEFKAMYVLKDLNLVATEEDIDKLISLLIDDAAYNTLSGEEVYREPLLSTKEAKDLFNRYLRDTYPYIIGNYAFKDYDISLSFHKPYDSMVEYIGGVDFKCNKEYRGSFMEDNDIPYMHKRYREDSFRDFVYYPNKKDDDYIKEVSNLRRKLRNNLPINEREHSVLECERDTKGYYFIEGNKKLDRIKGKYSSYRFVVYGGLHIGGVSLELTESNINKVVDSLFDKEGYNAIKESHSGCVNKGDTLSEYYANELYKDLMLAKKDILEDKYDIGVDTEYIEGTDIINGYDVLHLLTKNPNERRDTYSSRLRYRPDFKIINNKIYSLTFNCYYYIEKWASRSYIEYNERREDGRPYASDEREHNAFIDYYSKAYKEELKPYIDNKMNIKKSNAYDVFENYELDLGDKRSLEFHGRVVIKLKEPIPSTEKNIKKFCNIFK